MKSLLNTISIKLSSGPEGTFIEAYEGDTLYTLSGLKVEILKITPEINRVSYLFEGRAKHDTNIRDLVSLYRKVPIE